MTNATQRISIGKVFVPGGMPELTYVPRTERHLEANLAEVEDNLCKLVVVTGPTKTGKTVLVRKVLDSTRGIVWVDGGLVTSEKDFWEECLRAVEAENVIESETAFTDAKASKLGGGASARVFGIGASGSAELSDGQTSATTTKSAPTGTLGSRAIAAMSACHAVLVIDDFHYLSRDLQGRIVRSLKGEIFKGFPVVVIAIPHRRYDAVRVEREMNGRLEPIKVPDWSVEELMEIPGKGFPLLGMSIDADLTRRLAADAYGSPHLMQEFCKVLAKRVERAGGTRAEELLR